MKLQATLSLIAALLLGIAAQKQVWNFESDTPGKIAKGFRNEVGRWEVKKEGENHVLYQMAKSDDDTFNVTLVEGTNFKDIDLSVRLKAVEGKLDQGGGLVWRTNDKSNYYIAPIIRWKTTSESTRSRAVNERCSRAPSSPATRTGTRSVSRWSERKSLAISTARNRSRPTIRHFPAPE